MDILMSKGSVGEDVERLRKALAKALGGDVGPRCQVLRGF